MLGISETNGIVPVTETESGAVSRPWQHRINAFYVYLLRVLPRSAAFFRRRNRYLHNTWREALARGGRTRATAGTPVRLAATGTPPLAREYNQFPDARSFSKGEPCETYLPRHRLF